MGLDEGVVALLANADMVCRQCGDTVAGELYLDHAAGCDGSPQIEDPFTYPGLKSTHLDGQLDQERSIAEAGGMDPLSERSGPSWTKVNDQYGQRYAAALFTEFSGDLDRSIERAETEWAKVTSDPDIRKRLGSRGFVPADFTDPDRDLRMNAHMERGDLEFEGRLLSNAYALSSHQVDGRRVVGSPKSVPSTTGSTSWGHLTTRQQLSYIDGYASATAAIEEARNRGDWTQMALHDRGQSQKAVPGDLSDDETIARQAGWRQAVAVGRFVDDVSSGATSGQRIEVAYGSSVGGTVSLRNVRYSQQEQTYFGDIDGPQDRYGPDGGTYPWRDGATVRFEADQYLAAHQEAR